MATTTEGVRGQDGIGEKRGDLRRAAPGTAFSLGWAMAELYRPPGATATEAAPAHLPAVTELGSDERTRMAFAELRVLAEPFGGTDVDGAEASGQPTEPASYKPALLHLHYQLLEQLISHPAQMGSYQLGRALSDICAMPTNGIDVKAFLRVFDRQQLAALQGLLGQAGSSLPAQAGSVVGRSLQNWQDWANVNAAVLQQRDAWRASQANISTALRNQGHAWHALLAGHESATTQPSTDAWIHAGASKLRTIRALAGKVLRKCWWAVALVLAATGGLLYVVAANASGASKVWASLVTVGGALGVSGAGVRSTALRVARPIEQDVANAASLDARAWQATWLPTLPQSLSQRHRLSSRGVGVPQVMKGLEGGQS